MSKKYDYEHIKIFKSYYKTEIKEKHHVHHIDGNHKNNDPLNLIAIHSKLHTLIHRISQIEKNGSGLMKLPNRNQIEFLEKEWKHNDLNILRYIDPKTWNLKRRLPKKRSQLLSAQDPLQMRTLRD